MPASVEAELDTVEVAYDVARNVGPLTPNRPDRPNAMDPQLSSDVVAGLERLEGVDEDADGVGPLRYPAFRPAGSFPGGTLMGSMGPSVRMPDGIHEGERRP